MRELEQEDIESKRKMSEIKNVFYKSLELKRESPLHTRPVAFKVKDKLRDIESDDGERDLGEHVLDCELDGRQGNRSSSSEQQHPHMMPESSN